MTRIARVAGFAGCVLAASLIGTDAAQADSAGQCSALTRAPNADTKITSATLMTATATLPEYCNVQGNIGPGTIGFVVQLPTKWKAAPKQADDD